MFGPVVGVLPSVLNHLVGFVKFFEGLESRYDAGVVSIFDFGRLELFSGVGTYKEGKGGVENVNRNGELTLVDIVHLECPPGNAFMSLEPPTVKIFDCGDFAPKMMHESVKKICHSS